MDATLLRRSWESWTASDLVRVGPYWLQLVWTALFCAALAFVFTFFGFLSFARTLDDWLNLNRWAHWYGNNLAACLIIGYLIHALFEGIGRLVGAPRIRVFRAWQRVVFYAGVPMLGVAIGWPASAWLLSDRGLDIFSGPSAWRMVTYSIGLTLLMTFVLYHWFGAKARAIEAERRATEAQLRLLQAQIEPHFLFNTLANVHALIEHDAPKARRMLGAFTDYLRAGLANLRRERAPLADELALAEAYLRVQQSRMEERLRFTIEADEAARRGQLPPLMLQPLVENAVVHGLEPRVDGGTVKVRARVEAGALVVEVRDEGQGPRPAGKAAPRAGQGLALANVRERLHTSFGDAATLELVPGEPGTLARLRVPLELA
jgi:hypothetical protein